MFLKLRKFPPGFSAGKRLYHNTARQVFESPNVKESVTESFGSFISQVQTNHLTDTVLHRSKRMILDNIGVGLLGSTTQVFNIGLNYCQKMFAQDPVSSVYGRQGLKLSPAMAAFVNGIAVHSMDFDDTWHPATHPSGAVLPALLAAAEMLPPGSKPTGLDLLLAFNVGIEIQGRLMRFSREAHNIPKRFHPPSVVGTMGSAAAVAKFLSLNQNQCMNALAIAASLSGAPMANAATQAKPIHIGNATRLGFEAAVLASNGMEGSAKILDDIPGCFGFGAFYGDYQPQPLAPVEETRFLLEDQDIAFKRFPAHLGMHWVADAAASVRELMITNEGSFSPSMIDRIILRVPASRYINRQFPESEHQARHSFQFNACSALLDGEVNVESFSESQRCRPELSQLLHQVTVQHPDNNPANFEKMYGEVVLVLSNRDVLSGRCDTFYGHWRNPLSRESLLRKFTKNASHVLEQEKIEAIIDTVKNLERERDSSNLGSFLQ
ncbi:immunoresponsive gene 1, like [Callorhinchus milii]|uniref:Cis-aconitate decarboxylase n=1 Tax=Callorhinchus milii TaxID=7868 RepID=V9KGK3_CALMI|nr:immunoresponsive gene 1, like [Callorhinchus milii]|eukprot:gi/632935357/ref/XP_007889744.1/ PREDICTED: cis-aconitate decarboxylase [Callorhinchus milii]